MQGKVALVTGGGAGIGRAVAERLAREGAAVVVADLDEARATETVRRIEADGGQAAFVYADMTIPADIRGMVAFAVDRFGGLDILVNNAGGAEPPCFPDAEPVRWQRVLDVNLRAVMIGTDHGIRTMRERGGGAIGNIGSTAGLGFAPHWSPEYAAAKAGVVRFTAALGSLKEEANIRVNCICPGSTDTPAMQRSLARMTPKERDAMSLVLLQPDAIAGAVVMFVRDVNLAGRVMVWREGEAPRLIPVDAGDGYLT
jgi:NAD(P)-dependent dehydrogenase (short-subunit alcohol dehydrogenase family)